eukprot:TRINITY_DN3380_c0_g1_i1.p1 TRINITY_DN3380_c0_g1~~TRINITY_DN3380_c0_g1_i1.p1  ORF type:complete len:241 (-),score=46.05 TRINITY_DN3380_c0_g1_i1:34-756(-)
MKILIQQNPEGARELLTQNPQLAQGLLHIQASFGLITFTEFQNFVVKREPVPPPLAPAGPPMGYPPSGPPPMDRDPYRGRPPPPVAQVPPAQMGGMPPQGGPMPPRDMMRGPPPSQGGGGPPPPPPTQMAPGPGPGPQGPRGMMGGPPPPQGPGAAFPMLAEMPPHMQEQFAMLMQMGPEQIAMLPHEIQEQVQMLKAVRTPPPPFPLPTDTCVSGRCCTSSHGRHASSRTSTSTTLLKH